MGKIKLPAQIEQHEAHKYALSVIAGDVVANRWIKLACKRYLSDLKGASKRGLLFDVDAASHAIDFCESYCSHSKGSFAGQLFKLSQWQKFLLWQLFGWKVSKTGLRRFVHVYLAVARKNGKTTLAAAIALYLMVADGEAGAEIYVAATKRDQAKICWTEAKRMVAASSALSGKIDDRAHGLYYRNSKCEPLGADADSMDGLNPHGVIIDELHAHKTRETWDVLNTALGFRQQPVVFAITTAGKSRHSVCWEQQDYSERVLNGITDDDSWLALIYGLDDGDDCFDESLWIKANPNLGISKQLEYMRKQAKKAKAAPSSKQAFQRLDCNVWTDSVSEYLPLDVWDLAEPQAYETDGGECFAGMDLANKQDIAAFVELFPNPDDNCLDVECMFWLPRDALNERVLSDGVPYDVWADQGFIKLTQGNVIDYETIRQDIMARADKHRIRELAFDPWSATQISQQLMADGIPCVEFPQRLSHFATPTKELLPFVLSKRLRHGRNPVLRWMATNLVVWSDANENMRPDKKNSREKIDGMVALIMALGRYLLHTKQEDSPYDTMGV